jgi:glutamate-1-semialdehyde 2,1-aminomutase
MSNKTQPLVQLAEAEPTGDGYGVPDLAGNADPVTGYVYPASSYAKELSLLHDRSRAYKSRKKIDESSDSNETDNAGSAESCRPHRISFTESGIPGCQDSAPPVSNPGTMRRTHPAMPRLRLAAQAAAEATRILCWTTYYAGLYLVRRDRGDRRLRLATTLRSYLLRMGPLYMKAGQVLGTQSGLLPKQATDEFRSFFSGLPPMRQRALVRVIRKGLRQPVEEVFDWFDWSPIAVGSVAQVHHAVLNGGQHVAVKVVKSGVRARLEASSWLLAKLLWLAHLLFPPMRKYSVPGYFSELRPLLTGQCDMWQEAQRQSEIARNFRNHPYLRIPRTFDALCGEDILIMEYMEGTPGQEAADARYPGAALASRLQDIFYSMVYFHGQFHVDPHPGNVMFGADGQIILLDFGLVGHLSEDDKWNLSSFYYAVILGEWELAVKRFTRAFVAQPGQLDSAGSAYVEELSSILRAHFQDESSRWSTMAFFDDATRLLRRYRARVSTRFSLLALSLLTGEGFISQVDPEIDIWHNARRFTDRFSPYLSEELRGQIERELGQRIPESMATSRDASRYLVAPTHLDRFVLPSAFPLIVRDASGSKIRDIDGNEYIDLSCGYGPHILGYAHPRIVSAIAEAAAEGAVNALASPRELLLAEQIAGAFGQRSKVILSNSGTEAVLMALKIARAYTGRQKIGKLEGHYHGFSDQGMVSSWFRYRGDALRPDPVANSAGVQQSVVDDTLVLQYGEPATLERIAMHAGSLAAVILEPMPAALADIDSAFLRELREVCRRHGILVIYDEVVTGFRVHYGGAQHIAGVEPDLTCLGKIIGGGLPCGALVGDPAIIDIARTTGDPFLDVDSRVFVGGTMSGNSITAAAGAAALGHLRDHPEIYDELRRKTAWLAGELKAHAVAHDVPCNIKGTGSIFSITFDYAIPRRVRDRLAGSNMKANLALAYYLRSAGVYMPELHTMMLSDAHSDTDLEQVSDAFGNCISRMSREGYFSV